MVEQMKLIARPRQAGKTTELVELAHCDPRIVIITFSAREADRIRNQYPELNPQQVMDWRSYASKYDLHSRTRPAVDNMDLVLNEVLGTWVEIGTLSQADDKSSMSILRGKGY